MAGLSDRERLISLGYVPALKEIKEAAMSQMTSPSVPVNVYKRAVRQVWICLVIRYAIPLGIALAVQGVIKH